MNDNELGDVYEKLKGVVRNYFDVKVIKPALETVEKDFDAQNQLAEFILLIEKICSIVLQEGTEFDNDSFKSLSREEALSTMKDLSEIIDCDEEHFKKDDEIYQRLLKHYKKFDSKKYLLAYMERELNWIIISIFSASYISALILMRSFFELLIAIATRTEGNMKDRIDQISFLSEQEQAQILKMWNRLCGWAHPYGRWLKMVCPLYAAHTPVYHPSLCDICRKELKNLVDFILVISIEKFEIHSNRIVEIADRYNIILDDYELLSKRISK